MHVRNAKLGKRPLVRRRGPITGPSEAEEYVRHAMQLVELERGKSIARAVASEFSALPRDVLRFVVEGPPVPGERARTFRHPRTGAVTTTTPPRTRAYRKYVRLVAQVAANRALWRVVEGDAYGIRLIVFRGRKAGDWDNFAKTIQDSLKGVLWRDDARVLVAFVVVFDDASQPRVEVAVTAFAGGEVPLRFKEVWFP